MAPVRGWQRWKGLVGLLTVRGRCKSCKVLLHSCAGGLLAAADSAAAPEACWGFTLRRCPLVMLAAWPRCPGAVQVTPQGAPAGTVRPEGSVLHRAANGGRSWPCRRAPVQLLHCCCCVAGKPLDTVWDAAAPCSEASFLSVSQARVTDASECSGRCTQAKDNVLAMMVKLCTRYVQPL